MPLDEPAAAQHHSEQHATNFVSTNGQVLQPEPVLDNDPLVDSSQGHGHVDLSLNDGGSCPPRRSLSLDHVEISHEEKRPIAQDSRMGLTFDKALTVPMAARSSIESRGSTIDRPSTSSHADQDENMEELCRVVQRIAGYRMRALKNRSSTQEESANVRRVQKELVSAVQQFLTKASGTEGGISPWKKGGWQEDVVNIVDLLQEADTAGKLFEKKQDRVQSAEWKLFEAEEEVYPHFRGSDSQRALSEEDDKDDEDEDEPPSEPASVPPSIESEYPPAPMFEDQSNRVDIPGHENDEFVTASSFGMLQRAKHKLLAGYAPRAVSAPERQYDQLRTTLRSVEVTSSLTIQIRLKRSAHVQPEELQCLGSQFTQPLEPSIVAQANKDKLLKNSLPPTNFPEYDLEGFSKWLAYGVPWIGHMVHESNAPYYFGDASRDKDVHKVKELSNSQDMPAANAILNPATAHLQFLFAWKLTSLEAVYLGLPLFSQVKPSKEGAEVLELVKRSWVRQWFWEPEMKMGVGKRFDLTFLSPVASMQVHAAESRTMPNAGKGLPTTVRKRRSRLSIIKSVAVNQAQMPPADLRPDTQNRIEIAETTTHPDIPIDDRRTTAELSIRHHQRRKSAP